nr:hypothetical protein [Tanacetum cinerariifolium]
MYEEVERMYRNFSLLIHHGRSFRKFLNRKYRGALGSDEDVHSLSYLICNFKVVKVFIEHGITTLNNYYMSNSQIRAIIKEYHEDMGVEASSASPKKNELLMLEWYVNSTPAKASSNIGSVTPKSIPRGLFSHSCDETMILYTQLSGVNSCVMETSDVPRVCSQFGSISQAFKTQEKTMGDVIEDVMRSSPPFDLNIPVHVSTNEGILSDHAKVQDKLGEELANENEPNDVKHASVNEDNHNGYIYRDSEYDVDFSENEEANNYADVMIDKENEIHEAEVDVHFFGLRESDYQFTNIGLSSGRRSALNKLKRAFMQGEGDGSKYGFYCGQGFASSKEVKDMVFLHSIETKRELKLEARTYIEKHTCLQSREIKADTYNFFAKRILDQIKVNPRILVKAVQDILQRELEVHISVSKAFRAKPKQTRKSKWKGNINESLPTRIFKRIYVCLSSLNEGFKASKRDILRLYEASMKGPYQGQVLTTVEVDANNGIHSVAYALVEAETKNSWDKPIITLLEYTREYCLRRIVNVQAVFDKCDGPLTPTATRILNSIKKETIYITVQWNDGINYQVSRSFGDQYIVNNMAFNGLLVGKPKEWVYPCYKLSTWKEVYSHKVQPSNGGAGTSGGMFGNQRKASGSQAGVSQADMVGSQAFGSQTNMVGSQAFGSQEIGIETETSMAGSENRVKSDQRGATNHAHVNAGTGSGGFPSGAKKEWGLSPKTKALAVNGQCVKTDFML